MSSVQSTRARLLAVAIACLAAPAAAEDDVIENYESERCVRVSAINSTRVVNDGNVLFYMRGRKVYLNTLRAQCIGLAREKRFSYRVYTGQLCERDRISVLQDATFGIQQGRSCALGRFHPISREDAEALLNPQPEPPPKTPLETPPIEEVVKPPTPEE
jgi:hypothetical protein